MDPVQRLWMFESWMEEKKATYELAKNHAYLLGWFVNPELSEKINKQEESAISSSDEDFENSLKMVEQDIQKSQQNQPTNKKRRKRTLR